MQDKIIEIAKEWIDTPFHHQQCVKGHGVDCLQLVNSVGYEAGLCKKIPIENCNYSRKPNGRKLIEGMKDYLFEIETPVKGDIILIEWRLNLPMHLAIYIGGGNIIHATEQMGRVVESRWDFDLNINSFWRYIGLKNV